MVAIFIIGGAQTYRLESSRSPSRADGPEEKSDLDSTIHRHTTASNFLGRDFKGIEGVEQYSNALSGVI